jgi:hypothetical protein
MSCEPVMTNVGTARLGIKDGLMTPNHAESEALLPGLDWRWVRVVAMGHTKGHRIAAARRLEC